MKKILLSTLFATLSFPMLSCAASFDCTKAASVTEKLICGDEVISKMDEQLATSYKAALEKSAGKEAFKKTQIEWLKQQRACKDTTCLTQAYKERIEVLNKLPGQPITSSSPSSKPKFTITKGRQFELCRVFNDYLNSQYYKLGDCHVGNYPPDLRLRSPKYRQVDAGKYKKEFIKKYVKDKQYLNPDAEKTINELFDSNSLWFWEIDMDLDADGVSDTLLIERYIPKEKFENMQCYDGIGDGNVFLTKNGRISEEWGSDAIAGDPFLFDERPYFIVNGRAGGGGFIAEPNLKNRPVKESFPTTGICEFGNN